MKKIMLPLYMATLLISCGKNDKECAEWMEGDDCQTQIRTKYVGIYSGSSIDETGYVINNQDVGIGSGNSLNELTLLMFQHSRCILNSPSSANFVIAAGTEISAGNFYIGEGSSGYFKGDSLYMHLVVEDRVSGQNHLQDFKCKKRL